MDYSKKNREHKNSNKNVVDKKVRLTTIMAMAILSLSMMSCKEEKKENTKDDSTHSEMNSPLQKETKASFSDTKTAAAFQHYIHIKTALVNSDASEAQSGAKMLIENIHDTAMKSAVSTIAESDDIEIQRKSFSEVTAQIEPMLKTALSSGKVFKQFCPMAFNNSGGYWLSNDKEIRNPYFGDKMLKCGKVTETIELPKSDI